MTKSIDTLKAAAAGDEAAILKVYRGIQDAKVVTILGYSGKLLATRGAEAAPVVLAATVYTGTCIGTACWAERKARGRTGQA